MGAVAGGDAALAAAFASRIALSAGFGAAGLGGLGIETAATSPAGAEPDFGGLAAGVAGAAASGLGASW